MGSFWPRSPFFSVHSISLVLPPLEKTNEVASVEVRFSFVSVFFLIYFKIISPFARTVPLAKHKTGVTGVSS